MSDAPPSDAVARPRRRLGPRSLRLRLLAATLLALALALALAGFVLAGLFRAHVLRQYELTLTQQLDQLTARLDFDATGQPVLDPASLSDPRWQRPFSGLYWQIDDMAADGGERRAVLRSRSLWDTRLALAPDPLPDAALHVHEVAGPQGSDLLLLERTVRPADGTPARWRLMVAADLQDTRAAVAGFNRVLGLSLAALGLLLALAAWAQVAVGLRPLRALQRSLQDLRQARAVRLQGAFPLEVQPLVDDFNSVLDRHDEGLARARTQAGNLAHALKTPLTVLDQAASRAAAGHDEALAPLVQEQVRLARRHIDWQLARARSAATQRLPWQRTAVAPVIDGLLRVMARVHAERGLALSVAPGAASLDFAGEAQDLQEMLGNLLDNACKWAASTVTVRAGPLPGGAAPRLTIAVEDDGPGIDARHLPSVLDRGVRLDESVPGSGLGLAIVRDLVEAYGGTLVLAPRSPRGLCATLTLPALD